MLGECWLGGYSRACASRHCFFILFHPFPNRQGAQGAGEEDGLMGDVADERGDLLHAPIETRVAHAVGDRGRVIGMSLRVQVKNVQKEARGQVCEQRSRRAHGPESTWTL